jgi:hypothetical protein
MFRDGLCQKGLHDITSPENLTSEKRCKKCAQAYWRSHRKTGDKAKEARLRYAYGMNLSDYMELLDRQGGVCAICKNPETAQSAWGGEQVLCVDHDHITGKVRGLLCTLCNKGLGLFKDDVNTLEAAIDYLKGGET